MSAWRTRIGLAGLALDFGCLLASEQWEAHPPLIRVLLLGGALAAVMMMSWAIHTE